MLSILKSLILHFRSCLERPTLATHRAWHRAHTALARSEARRCPRALQSDEKQRSCETWRAPSICLHLAWSRRCRACPPRRRAAHRAARVPLTALSNHPDKGGDSDRFEAIQVAWEAIVAATRSSASHWPRRRRRRRRRRSCGRGRRRQRTRRQRRQACPVKNLTVIDEDGLKALLKGEDAPSRSSTG